MNYTILIADDEPEIRTLLRLYLENENYQIIEAENGKQALELLKKYGVSRCWYGHLHGPSCRLARTGRWEGIEFSLISADHLEFNPKKICD